MCFHRHTKLTQIIAYIVYTCSCSFKGTYQLRETERQSFEKKKEIDSNWHNLRNYIVNLKIKYRLI